MEEPWSSEKYCWSSWLSNKKNLWILDTLKWLKGWRFDLVDRSLIVLPWNSFFPLFPFFFLLPKKVCMCVCVCVCGGGHANKFMSTYWEMGILDPFQRYKIECFGKKIIWFIFFENKNKMQDPALHLILEDFYKKELYLRTV